MMEFWGIEVKPGESVKCKPGEDKYIHLSQATLGESKGKENVPLFVEINDQKLVIGTLSADKCSHISFDLVFEKEFQLSHTSKNTSVHFLGYKTELQFELSDTDDYPDSGSEPEEVPVDQTINGKSVVKQDQEKPSAKNASAVKEEKSASKKATKAEPTEADKPKATKTEPTKDDESDSEEDTGSDEDLKEPTSDDEDEDESSEEDEPTPKKAAPGKRHAESAQKTPAPEKKAKVVTPAGQKTGGDGKKGVVHVATPYPTKQVSKTSGITDKSKQQTPKSTGSVKCSTCPRTFKDENALQAHTKAKHG